MIGNCDVLYDCFFLALLAGFIIVPAVRYFAQMKLLLPPGKKVGPSYWGVYDGSPLKEGEELRIIAVRQPTFTEIVTAGSTVYSKGKPVKSLRR